MKKPTPKEMKRIKKVAVAGSIIVMVSWLVCGHIGYTITDSVKFRIFAHKKVSKLILGNYYVFKHNDSRYTGNAVKKLVCLPGQTVTRNSSEIYCDGVFIVSVKHTTDSSGNILPLYEGEILSNKAFFLGDHPNSYDSRYFGGVPLESITREVYPIW